MAFDVSRLGAAKEQREKGIQVALKDPKTGADLDAFIIVASYSSEKVKAKAREIVHEWEQKKKRDSQFMPGIDEQERLTIATACAAVLGWEGLEDGGKPWPFTPENVQALVSDPSIAGQIDKAAGNEANFFTA